MLPGTIGQLGPPAAAAALLAAVILPAAAAAQAGDVRVECRLVEHKTDGRTHRLEDGIPFLALRWTSDAEVVPRLDPVYVTAGVAAPDGYSLKFDRSLRIVNVERCLDERDLFQLVRTRDRREVIFKPGHPRVIVRLLADVDSVMFLDPAAVQAKIDRAGNAERWQEMQGLLAAATHLGVPLDARYQEELAYLNRLRELGLQEYGDKRYSDAVQHLAPVVEERPRDFEAALTLAKAQYQLGRYTEARHGLERLRSENARHPEVMLYLGLVALTQDDLRAAESYLRGARRAGARDAPFFLGFTLYKRGDHPAAKGALQEFLATNPGSDLATRARALLETVDGQSPEPPDRTPDRTQVAGAPPASRPQLNVPPAGGAPGRAAEPRPAGEVAARDPAGRSLAGSPLIFRGFRRPARPLAEVLDRPVVLHLWASWCGPCLYELPSLIDFYRTAYGELREAGLELLVVSVDHDVDDLTRYVDDKLPALDDLPLYWDPNWTLATELDLDSALPKTVLVDRGGLVRRVQEGSLDWRSRRLADELRALAAGSGGRP